MEGEKSKVFNPVSVVYTIYALDTVGASSYRFPQRN